MAGRDSPSFKVRITQDLDEWIERQAKANCRSKTAEVEFRLNQARRYAEQHTPHALEEQGGHVQTT